MLVGCVALLLAVSLYLTKRLSDEKTANAALRSRVASLKRQLMRAWGARSDEAVGRIACAYCGILSSGFLWARSEANAGQIAHAAPRHAALRRLNRATQLPAW
jgi:hypothetical protein